MSEHLSGSGPASEAEWQIARRAVEKGWINQGQADDCVRESDREQRKLSDILLSRGYLTPVQLAQLQGSDAAGPATVGLPAEVTKAMADPERRVGKYVIVRQLGSGGMGFVVLAYDVPLQRWVALKFLKAIGDDTARAYFDREARIAAQLSHPNIAAIYEVGENAGMPFIAMQYIEGDSLFAARKKMTRAQMVKAIREAAGAVDHAHKQGIIHRDLKPANLMLDREGRLFVMDFGLSKQTEVEGLTAGLSGSNLIMGTPAYMSPEQARGDLKSVDRVSDVYSLGASLYEMLTERPPFKAESQAEILIQVISEEPVKPRKLVKDLPEDLETITMKCLEKEKHRRYADARELAEDLSRYEQGEAIQAHPPSVIYRLGKRIRRYKAASAAIILASLLALGAAGYFLGPARVEIETPMGTTRETYWPAGRRSLRFTREGYDDQQIEMILQAWRVARWTPPLVLDHGYVSVESTPPGADVTFIIGGRASVTGRAGEQTFRVPKGTHEVRLKLPDYAEASVPVFVGAGETTTLQKTLSHETGLLNVTCFPEGVSMTLGGRIYALPSARLELPTGRYTARFEKFNHFSRAREIVIRKGGSTAPALGDGVIFRQDPGATQAHATLSKMEIWSFRSEGVPTTGIALADLDGDGIPDAVFGTEEGRVIAVSGRDGKMLWEFRGSGAMAPPAIADVNADGIPDVIVGSSDGLVYAISGRDGRPIWSFQAGAAVRSPCAVGNLEGDGRPDCIFGTADGRVCALSGRDGTKLWQFKAEGAVVCAPTLADLNGDGVPDCIAGSMDGKVYALSGRDGKPIWSVLAGRIEAPPALADLNRDGVPDCIVGSLNGYVLALSGKDGSLIWRFRTDGPVRATPALADLDGDGIPDVVVGSTDGNVYAASGADGSWIWIYAIGGLVASSPALLDVNGDGVPDCIIGSPDGTVHAVSGADGTPLWHYKTGGEIRGAPAMADLEGNGVPDFVVASADGSVTGLHGWDPAKRWEVELASAVFSPPIAADLDGDGIPDWIVVTQDWHVHAFSGRDGSRLWEFRGPSQVNRARLARADSGESAPVIVLDLARAPGKIAVSGRDGRLLPDWKEPSEPPQTEDADLDGDGVPDPVRIVAGPKGEARIVATSGKTGKELWSRDIARLFGSRELIKADACSWARAPDLNGDQVPDFLVYPQVNGVPHLAVLSGRDGRTLWSAVASGPIEGSPVWADVNGDGVADCILSINTGVVEAISGRDGKGLGWINLPTVARSIWVLGDVDGDGAADFVVTCTGRSYVVSGKSMAVIGWWKEAALAAFESGVALLENSSAIQRTFDPRTGVEVRPAAPGQRRGLSAIEFRPARPTSAILMYEGLRKSARDRIPEEMKTSGDRMTLLQRLGEAELVLGNPTGALVDLRMVAASGRSSPELQVDMIIALLRTGDLTANDLAGLSPEAVALLQNDVRVPPSQLIRLADMATGDSPQLLILAFKGEEALKTLEMGDPYDVRVLIMRGLALLQLSRIEEARRDLDRARLLSPYDPILHRLEAGFLKLPRSDALVEQADTDRRNLKFEAAIAAYNQALRLAPHLAKAFNGRGLARYKSGDVAGARADFDRAIELEPDPITHILRAVVREELKDLDGANADLTRAIETWVDPSPEEIKRQRWPILGRSGLYFRRGKLKASREDLDGAIADYTLATKEASNFADAFFERGAAWSSKGDFARALADLDQAIALSSSQSRYFWWRGYVKEKRGDSDGAIADYSMALKLDPKEARIWLARGEAKWAKQDVEGAISDFSKAVELRKDYVEAFNNRGLALESKGDFQAALEDFNRVLILTPLSVAYYNRGRVKYALNDYPGAIEDMTRAIELKDWAGPAQVLRARAKSRLGDPEGALSDLDRAIELNGKDAEAYYYRAALKRERKDAGGARSDLNRVLALNPRFAAAWLDRGLLRLEMKDAEGAFEDVTRALKVAPPNWGDKARAEKALEEARRQKGP